MPWGGLNGTAGVEPTLLLPTARSGPHHQAGPKSILIYNHWASTLGETQSLKNVQAPPLPGIQGAKEHTPRIPRTQTPRSQ